MSVDTHPSAPPAANPELARKLRWLVIALTIAVWAVVGAMRNPSWKRDLPEGVSLNFLPGVHAGLNTLVALLLVGALVMVKRGRIDWHQRLINAALVTSGLFLLGYVAYHFTTPETRYGGEGVGRVVYLTLLISHISLAALSFPLILQTWVYGMTGLVAQHRRMAKWVFPIWLYVAVTGPICYLMLRPYYAG